mmetsp:Transcript_19770/g.43656  ORF Transcript_19770/g.43656 Transcript_19770/m.43656 type:complete len:200 (+) Transcript_19770:344-943(+)
MLQALQRSSLTAHSALKKLHLFGQMLPVSSHRQILQVQGPALIPQLHQPMLLLCQLLRQTLLLAIQLLLLSSLLRILLLHLLCRVLDHAQFFRQDVHLFADLFGHLAIRCQGPLEAPRQFLQAAFIGSLSRKGRKGLGGAEGIIKGLLEKVGGNRLLPFLLGRFAATFSSEAVTGGSPESIAKCFSSKGFAKTTGVEGS